MEIPQDIRNIFSRRALAALNACARFCYNMCMGWGISLKKGDGYVAVGIDQKQLLSWLKDERFATSCPKDVPTGATAADVTAVASRAPEDVKRAYLNENATDTTPTEPESGNSGDNKIARIGTSKFAARADHVHRDLALHDKVQKPTGMLYNDSNDGGKLKYKPPKFDRGGRYLGLDDTGAALAIHLANICGGSTAGVLATDANGAVSVKSIGTTNGTVAAGDHKHTTADITNWNDATSGFATTQQATAAAAAAIVADTTLLKTSSFPTSGSGNNGTANTPARSDHTHDIGAMPCTISGHSGNCLLVVGPPDANGKSSVTHSENDMYNAADSLTSALQAAGTTAILTRNTSKGVTAITLGSNNTVLCVGSGGALEWKSASSLAPSASAVAGELAGDATAISGIAASLAADSAVVGAIAAEVETDVDDEDVAAAVAALVQSSVTPTASDVAAIVADNVEANVTPSTAQVASAVAAEIADGIAENIDSSDVESGVVDSIATTLNTQSFQNSVVEAVAEEIDTSNITDQDIISATAALIHSDVTDADIADAVEEALETNNAANAVNALASDYSSGLPYVKRSDIGSASGLQVDAQNNNAVSVKLATNKGLEVLTGNNPGLAVKIDANGGLQTGSNGLAVKLETNGGIAVGNDGLKLETLHQTTLNLANMLTCTNNGNGSYTLSFFPPQVDGRGRITGLAQNAAWSVALLEDA